MDKKTIRQALKALKEDAHDQMAHDTLVEAIVDYSDTAKLIVNDWVANMDEHTMRERLNDLLE